MNRFVLTAMAFVFVFLGAITVCIAWRLSSRDMPSGTESVKKPAGYNDEILSRWDLDECHSGQMKSEDLEGKVHIVSFFFATCPGTCNLQNTHLRAIAQQYGAKGVKFLSITTDPKVDSRAALSKYAGGFSANPDHWYFLRSDDIVYLRRIGAEMYKVGGVKEKGHQDIFVLVDKWGNLRLFCDWKTEKSRAELLAKIDELLAETEEPAHLDDGLDDEPRRPPGYEDELEEQAEEAAAAAAEEKAAEEQAAEEQAAEEQAAEEQAAEEQSAESVK